MSKTIEGIVRNGQVELLEPVTGSEGARVLVTILPAKGPVDLSEHGIDERQAADLRGRLRPFAEDWERPEMDVYDDV